jgi:hypothetical protein
MRSVTETGGMTFILSFRKHGQTGARVYKRAYKKHTGLYRTITLIISGEKYKIPCHFRNLLSAA